MKPLGVVANLHDSFLEVSVVCLQGTLLTTTPQYDQNSRHGGTLQAEASYVLSSGKNQLLRSRARVNWHGSKS